MRDSEEVPAVHLDGRASQAHVHEAGRFIIGTDITFTREWRDSDGVLIENGIIQRQTTVNVALHEDFGSVWKQTPRASCH